MGTASSAPNFELSAAFWTPTIQGLSIPQDMAAHLDRVYVPLYQLKWDPTTAANEAFNDATGGKWPAWRAAMGVSTAAKAVGLVFNSYRSVNEAYHVDGLRMLFGDPALASRAAAELIGKARRDGLAGLCLQFQGELPTATGAYARWVKELRDRGREFGLQVDVMLNPRSASNENLIYGGVQSYDFLGAVADRSLASLIAVQYGPGGGVAAPEAMFAEQLDYMTEHLPQGRALIIGQSGGVTFQDDRVRYFGPEAWAGILKQGYRPRRAADGLLHVQMEDKTAAYADAATMARWANEAWKRGFRGICLSSPELTDPGFWRWWDMNKARLNAPYQKD